jgi:hypothetical protein
VVLVLPSTIGLEEEEEVVEVEEVVKVESDLGYVLVRLLLTFYLLFKIFI